jgi:WD40 repeat protein
MTTFRLRYRLPQHLSEVCNVAFNQDGTKIASASIDWMTRTFDVYTRQPIDTYSLSMQPGKIMSLAWQGSHPEYVSRGTNLTSTNLTVRTVGTGMVTQTYDVMYGWVDDIQWRPDGSKAILITLDQNLTIYT